MGDLNQLVKEAETVIQKKRQRQRFGGETGKHSGFGSWQKLRQFGQNVEDLKRDNGKM